MGTNVVSLSVVRELRKAKQGDPAYEAQILKMDKLQLLEEMMNFQEQRAKLGHLSIPMMVRGQILFKALEVSSETEELKQLARSYRRHLKYELDSHFKKNQAVSAKK